MQNRFHGAFHVQPLLRQPRDDDGNSLVCKVLPVQNQKQEKGGKLLTTSPLIIYKKGKKIENKRRSGTSHLFAVWSSSDLQIYNILQLFTEDSLGSRKTHLFLSLSSILCIPTGASKHTHLVFQSRNWRSHWMNIFLPKSVLEMIRNQKVFGSAAWCFAV